MPMACPHCGAENPIGLDICNNCGMALPTPFLSTPSFITDTLPTTAAGRKLQGYELQSKAKDAAVILGLIAVLTFAGTVLDLYMLPSGTSSTVKKTVVMIDSGILAAFVGLAAWATKQPLPAARFGLIFYLGLQLIIAVLNPESICKGVIMKGFIVMGLIKAIQAGSAGKELESME